MGTRCAERDLLERFKVVGTNSSHVRESNTDFDSGFQAMDSGFQVLDSLSLELGFRIPRAVFRIPLKKISWIPKFGFNYMGRTQPSLQAFSARSFLDSTMSCDATATRPPL